MKRGIITVVLVFAAMLRTSPALAQGCSDAGLCTVPDFDAESSELRAKAPAHRMAAGLSFGKGNQSIDYVTTHLGYTRQISRRIAAAAKATFASANGELGNHAGLGDLFFTVSARPASNAASPWRIFAGGKFPLGAAIAGPSAISLPMDYQSTLGSFDLLLGASYAQENLSAVLGLQLPLSGANSNTFVPDRYGDTRADNYHPSNRFSRKSDVMLRLTYIRPDVFLGMDLRPGFLALWHAGRDTYADSQGRTHSIDGSQGLTLNANVAAVFPVAPQQSVELLLAFPMITRDARPDGLTRSLVLSAEYQLAIR